MTQRISFDRFSFDPTSHELFDGPEKRVLQPKPAAILALLLEHQGSLVTRKMIIDRVWPDRTVDYEQRILTSIKQIRGALGDDAANPEFVETVPTKGYRFVADCAVANNKLAVRKFAPFIAAALVAVAIFAFIFVGAGQRGDEAMAPDLAAKGPRQSLLLVLPGAGESERERIVAAGIADEILAHLSRIRPQTLGVIARTTAAQFKNTPISLARAGDILGVDYALETTVYTDQNQQRVRFALSRLSDNTQLYAKSIDIGAEGYLNAREDVAAQIAQVLNVRLTRAVTPEQATTTLASPAFDAYLTGRHYMSLTAPDSKSLAIEHFQQAIAADSSFAPAYAALARIYRQLDGRGDDARAMVERALQLDPELAEAHEIAGEIAFYDEWNIEAAQRSFEAAVELEPGRASARLGLATLKVAQRDFDGGLAEAAVARMLDPLSGIIYGEIGWFYLYADNPAFAVRDCKRALELNIGDTYRALIANDCLVLAHHMLGDLDSASIAAKNVMDLFGAGDPSLESIKTLPTPEGFFEAYWRWRIDAMGQFDGVEVDIAKSYIALGDYPNAIQTLEKAFEARSPALVFINADPSWDPLRDDPAFISIAAEIAPRSGA